MASQRLKIVLAGDTVGGMELERTFLQRRGFQILTATNGSAALALAIAELPEVVILDQALPGLTAAEVCSRLKACEQTRRIPVVLVGDQDSNDIRQACRDSGVDAFVPRSAGREALLQAVARILHIPARRSARITVLFRVVGDDREALGRAVELSEGGMCLEVNRHFNDNAQLLVRFMLPGKQEEMKIGARVCWVKQGPKETYSVGLEFTELTESDRRRLDSYIDMSLSVGNSESDSTTLRGSFATMPLPDLLQWIHLAQRTGSLRIEYGKFHSELYFRQGRIIACCSDEPPRLLGQFLLFQGLITEDLLRRSMALHEAGGMTLGENLMNMGAVSSQALASAAAAKAEETIFSLLDCAEAGVFDFEPNVTPHARVTQIALDVDVLLLRIMKRVDDRERVRTFFKEPRILLARTDRQPSAEALSDWATRQIYLSVDGERTLEEIVLRVHGTEFLVMECLFGLHKDGYVEIKGTRPGAGADAAAVSRATGGSAPEPDDRRSSVTETAAALPISAETGTEQELETARRLISSGKYEAGLEILNRRCSGNPHDVYVRRLIGHTEEALLIQLTNEGLSPSRVPVPARSRDDIAREELSAEEDFLLNLSDGTWDIKSLTYVSPMRPLDVVLAIRRLLERGLIELRDPEKHEAVPADLQGSGADFDRTGFTEEEIEELIQGGGTGAR